MSGFERMAIKGWVVSVVPGQIAASAAWPTRGGAEVGSGWSFRTRRNMPWRTDAADVDACRLARVSRLLDPEELIDAQGVAEVLGLSQRNSVSAYQRRYPDMPRPVVNLGQGRCKLWLCNEIEEWRLERLAGSGR